MDKTEARAILARHMRHWEQRSYDELSQLAAVKHIEAFGETGRIGTVYQIEIQFFWDDSPNGVIRVKGAIDDGGMGAFFPQCSDELVYPKHR